MSKPQSVVSPSPSIFHIPPNILLVVFGYLDVKSLCLTSRVCRTWYNYANDPSLWKVLDLRPYRFSLRHMWKIINRRIADYSRELHMTGFISQTKKLDNLSTPLLCEIKKKAPDLSSLTLSYCSLKNIDIESFPENINKLCLSHSLVPLGWFETLNTRNVFPLIEDLDLSCCTRVSSEDVRSICHLHTLKTLKLCGCYRITDDDVKEIAVKLQNIVSLDISSCQKITDVSLHHISRHLRDLKRLCLCSCHLVSPLGIASLKDGNFDLELLNVTGCSEATRSESLRIFANCKNVTIKMCYLDEM